MITADPSRLLQVLDNVLSNAIKFTPTGGRITVCALRNGDGVDLVVTDTGMGIDPESLPHVGTAFFRTPRTGEAGIPGVGLGLMITKNIVEAHHGTLTISGREHEFLLSATGRKISLTAINMHDRSFDDLYAIQFYQREPGYAEVRYIPAPAFNQEALNRMKSSLREKLGDDFRYEFKQVSEVEKTNGGKHKWLVSEIKGR
jgi:signal transduction histidine kinase